MTWTVISLLRQACRITVHFSLNYFKDFEGHLVRTSCYQKPRRLRGLHYSFRKAQHPKRPRAVLIQPNRRFSPCLTFKNRAYYIYRTDVLLPSKCCVLYIFFSTNISTEYFKHAAHSPFFFFLCRLFHNATFFWFMYYSHFTNRVC
jgi:hypothetical protein